MTPWTAACQASMSFTISWSLFKLMSIELVMPSNHLLLCRPLLFLPSVFPSIRVFSVESALRIRGPKYWGFSFSVSPSNEYSGVISLRMDCFDLLAVQGTLKCLLHILDGWGIGFSCPRSFHAWYEILCKLKPQNYLLSSGLLCVTCQKVI